MDNEADQKITVEQFFKYKKDQSDRNNTPDDRITFDQYLEKNDIKVGAPTHQKMQAVWDDRQQHIDTLRERQSWLLFSIGMAWVAIISFVIGSI